MWKKIKSTFILKKIFINLIPYRKLHLIIYNKQIQEKLCLSLTDYRRFSERYKIVEDDIVKQYNCYTNKLLFKGHYKKGKKNGKGREYNKKGKLIFKGEYLNGLRNGEGKEYYGNDNLKFEGEYLNGLKNGKGKEYDYHGKLKFEGEYLNGEKLEK